MALINPYLHREKNIVIIGLKVYNTIDLDQNYYIEERN